MANKALGIGVDMKPGLYSAADSLSERALKVKAMCGLHTRTIRTALEQARDIGRELQAAKEQCVSESKGWLEWLATAGMKRQKAARYMRIAEYWTTLVEDGRFSHGLTVAEALEIIGDPEPDDEEEAATNGRPKGTREPGDDTPKIVAQIIRAHATIEKKAHDIIRVHDVPEDEAQFVLSSISGAIQKLKLFYEAPERPYKPPFNTECKDCGAKLLLAQTVGHGWIPLNAEQGGGNWEIEGNVAKKVAWDRSKNAQLYCFHNCPERPGKK